jgi:hypothetical protein
MRACDRLYVYPIESTSTGATAYKSIGLRLRNARCPGSLRCFLRIPRHFEADQQFDIAGGPVHAGFSDANGFVVRAELGPSRLKLIAGFRLIRSASFQRRLRAAFGSAFSCDIEFRHAVRDGCERERSKNNDREVSQHIRSPGKMRLVSGLKAIFHTCPAGILIGIKRSGGAEMLSAGGP